MMLREASKCGVRVKGLRCYLRDHSVVLV